MTTTNPHRHQALLLPPMVDSPVLAHAKELYRNCRYSEERWSDELSAQVHPHVDAVLAEIDRLSQR